MNRLVHYGSACMAALALMLGSAGLAPAELIYNNFAPGNGYNISTGWTIGQPGGGIRWTQGDPFTPVGADYILDRIELALGYVTGQNRATIWLMSDEGGRPGQIIETFVATNMGQFGQFNPPVVLDSVLHPTLQQGTQYWVVATADPGTWLAWNLNSTGAVGPHAQKQDDGPFNVNNNTHGAFRVSGDVIPEPATVTLLGLGAAGLLGYGWRRRKQPA